MFIKVMQKYNKIISFASSGGENFTYGRFNSQNFTISSGRITLVFFFVFDSNKSPTLPLII